MNKPKNKIIVPVIMAVYLGLIGANFAWQQSQGIASSHLKAALLENGCAPEDEVCNAEAKAAELEEATKTAQGALAAQKAKEAAQAAEDKAKDAQKAIQDASKTVGAKAAELQQKANEIALCIQFPLSCVYVPPLPPNIQSAIQTAKKIMYYKEIIEGVAAVARSKIMAAQAKIAAIRSGIAFLQKHRLAIPAWMTSQVQSIQQQSYSDCLQTATALSDREAASAENKATAESAKPTTLIAKTDENGLTTYSVGNENYVEGEGEPVDEAAIIAQKIAAEQQRQAQIRQHCAELAQPINQTPGGTNYGAMLTSLDTLGVALNTTAARNTNAINIAKTAAAQEIEDQRQAASAARLADTQQAVGAQLGANAKQYDQQQEAENPKPLPAVPMGFSNRDSEGNPLDENAGEIIPIVPIRAEDGHWAMPTWDYSPLDIINNNYYSGGG
ncbi:MAG: hypothetical protein V1936_00225 [Patescibacteria group bacterium]